MRLTAAIGAILALGLNAAAHLPALAADFPPLYVYGEKDDANARACNVSTLSAIAAAQRALRDKGVRIATEDDYFHDRALAVYLTTTVTSTCAAGVQLSIQTTTTLINPVTQQRNFAIAEFCNESSIMTGEDLQKRINADVVTLIGTCLDKYTKSVRAAPTPPRPVSGPF